MESDQIRWDEKYRCGQYLKNVSSIVSEFSHLACKGRALDIAAGRGRNSLFLAEQGFFVDAIDISPVGLDELKGKSSKIKIIQRDLDFFDPLPERYDLVININFLNRDLFSKIFYTLKIGGILIFETFVIDPAAPSGKPPLNRQYYLKANELLHEFKALHVFFYQEKEHLTLKGDKRRLASLAGQKIDMNIKVGI